MVETMDMVVVMVDFASVIQCVVHLNMEQEAIMSPRWMLMPAGGLRKWWGYLSSGCRGLLPPPCKEREWMLWMHGDSGKAQIGREVNIDGRTGKVVDGTILKILVEWDK